MGTFIDLTGHKYGRLTVLKRVSNKGGRRTAWLCKCDCGSNYEAVADQMRSGHTKSCGCYGRDNPSHLIHGDGSTRFRCREYRIWCHMIGRCFNPTDAAYKNYGGRGILVCDSWRTSYQEFLKDMGRCPKGKTLGRIDNNAGYCKSNCRWEDWHQQQRNRRNNHLLTYGGQTKSVAEWSEISGTPYPRLLARLKLGWSVEDAIWKV